MLRPLRPTEAGASPATDEAARRGGDGIVAPVESEEHATPPARGRSSRAPYGPSSGWRDVVLAVSGLAVTTPLVAVLAALDPLGLAGAHVLPPASHRAHQRAFTLVKLRTMDDAQAVTRVGRWLRPLGLDELPQLWNVLAWRHEPGRSAPRGARARREPPARAPPPTPRGTPCARASPAGPR